MQLSAGEKRLAINYSRTRCRSAVGVESTPQKEHWNWKRGFNHNRPILVIFEDDDGTLSFYQWVGSYVYICIYMYINIYIIVSTTTQPNPTRFWDLFRGKGNILSGRCCLWNCEGCEVTILLESVRKPRSYPESQDLNTWQFRSPEAGYWHIPRRKSDHKTKIRWGTAFVASPKGCILGWRAYGVPMCPVCSGGL